MQISNTQGFTLLEVMIAVMILAILCLGLISTVVTTYELNRINQEKGAALQTLKGVADTFLSEYTTRPGLQQFYSYYYTNNKGFYSVYNIPDASTLNSHGLRNVNVNNGNPGLVECWADETNATLQSLLPNPDLNGDSLVNTNWGSGSTLSNSCRILPVRLMLTWQSQVGGRAAAEYMVIILGEH
jgi:prepilin-type N-terminal cleavage/methylation domain-containing protein